MGHARRHAELADRYRNVSFRRWHSTFKLPLFRAPAELHNQVYSELLTLRPSSSGEGERYSPAILATCHQASDEGSSILYEENRFTIDISAYPFPSGNALYVMFVEGKVMGEEVNILVQGLIGMDVKWPGFLRKVKSTELVISLAGLSEPPSLTNKSITMKARVLQTMNAALYRLHCFLSSGKGTEELVVRLRCDKELKTSSQYLQDVISPVRLMAPKLGIHPDGFDEKKANAIRASIASAWKAKPCKDLLAKSSALRREAEDCVSLVERMNPIPKPYDLVRTRLESANSILLSDDYVTVEREKQLEAALFALEVQTDKVGTRDLKKMVEDVTVRYQRMLTVKEERVTARSNEEKEEYERVASKRQRSSSAQRCERSLRTRG